MNLKGFLRFLGQAGQAGRPVINTDDATVGAATLTAAAFVGGNITRSGSTAAYTDTTPTATQLVDALPGGNADVGLSWLLTIKNTVAFAQTLSGGTGVTVSGISIVPPLSIGTFLVTYTAAGTFTVVGLGSAPLANLPAAKFTTGALESATFAAADLTGADFVTYNNTGTTPGTLTTRTATQMFGDTPNAQVGQSYMLAIRNSSSGANTLTVGAGTGVTLTGTMTIAQNVTRLFVVTFTSATAVTIQSMGISAAGA
jgi:hypothetical protein